MIVGLPAQVWHGTADQTSGGITRAGLVMDNGQVKYRAQVNAQLKRTEREGKNSFAKVWGGKKGAPFTPAPKVGTPEYNKKIKKQKKKEKRK